MGFFDKLKTGLNKTKESFNTKINNVFSNFRKVDEDFLEELEEVLIMSDMGVDTSVKIVNNLRKRIKKDNIKDEEEVKRALREEIKAIFDEVENKLNLDTKPSVILVVGVNGVGKTTSIGKIANRIRKDGKKVVVAAADTFRAAAADQLKEWANRANVDIVMGAEGSDPGSVLYDAISSAKNKNADILLCDTAGRLHNKKYLMDELIKIKKVIDKEFAVCKINDVTEVNFNDEFCFVGKTDEELSLVCSSEFVPKNTIVCDSGWRAFRIEGILDFSLTGILARAADILANAKIPIFAVSTYNTDYILIKNEFFQKALDVLKENNYVIKIG